MLVNFSRSHGVLLEAAARRAIHTGDGCTDVLQIQKRINAVIESRRKAGEDLPPAPKTAIAGPEFFGFNQPEVSLP